MKQKSPIAISKIFVIIAGIALLSAGCGGGGGSGSAPHVVLNFWDPFITTQQIQPLITAYQQKRPNVQMVFTQKDINTYPQDLINALAAGTGPDIFSINNSWLPQYKDKVTPGHQHGVVLYDL